MRFAVHNYLIVAQHLHRRHKAFLNKVAQLTDNSVSASTSIKAAIRSYRSGESGANHLISTIHTVLKEDLDAIAGLFNLLVDLMEDETKRRDLLAAWNRFKIEVRNVRRMFWLF